METMRHRIDFSGLELRLGLVANLQNPSLAECENLWSVAVETHRAAILDGHKAGLVKKEIAAWLWQHVPTMGKSMDAIFRQLYRKIERIAEVGNLTDKRRVAAQQRRAPLLSKEDRAALIQTAVFECGGLVDYAWQTCLQKKTLSAEILKRYPAPQNHRPRCPQNIRRQIRAEVSALYQHHVRPHWNGNNAAPMTRDHSGEYAQDIFQSDDKTLDILCRIAVEESGEMIERQIRCQFLPMIDVKSGKILDFVLIGEANYNSISIRTLITKVCKKYGLPESFSFECGMWKTGKLLGNNAKGKPFAEVENFARRVGAPIHHALPGRARSKIVETVFRLLDRKMYGWPGYIGNDEMHKKFERATVNGLWTFDELFSQLVLAVEDYNNTKSESIVKGGYLTPNEVWENCRRKNERNEVMPASKLAPEFEYLLSDHCAEVVVHDYGIKTSIGREVFQFHSAALVDFMTGLNGQTVKLWFNPGEPETGVVTDLKEEKFFAVTRIPNAPAHASTHDDWQIFARASVPYRTHMRQLRQHYSDLKATYIPPFRATIADVTVRVKAQARSEAKENAGQQIIARQTTPVESSADRDARRAAQRAATEVFEQANQHLFV